MGFDEENLEPKPRKINKKNSTQSNTLIPCKMAGITV